MNILGRMLAAVTLLLFIALLAFGCVLVIEAVVDLLTLR